MLSDIFLASLFLYLAAVYIDLSFEGVVSRAFNVTILLIICIASGIGTVLFPHPRRSWVPIVVLSVMVGSIVAKISESLSPLALLIGAAGGIVVFLAGSAMIRQYDGE